MGLGTDEREALAECVDLINSGRPGSGAAAAGRSAPASAGQADPLATRAGVADFARRHRVENIAAARVSDAARLRDLRARLDAIAAACESGHEAAAIRDLNALLAETGAVPQIVEHDGRGPHIHVSRATAPLADRIAAHSAMGLAALIVAGESSRLRTCASPPCQSLFVDLSRNQSRRYCDSRTCGNRLHVAAYRSRRSAATPAQTAADQPPPTGFARAPGTGSRAGPS